MENLIFTGVSLEELLLRISQLIDAKISGPPGQLDNYAEYITRKEVASLLKISYPTLHDWTKQGWLQSYKIGNRVLYKKKEIENSLHQVIFQKYKKNVL